MFLISAPIFAAEKSSAASANTTSTLLAAAVHNAEPKVGDTIQDGDYIKTLKIDELLSHGMRFQAWKFKHVITHRGFTRLQVTDPEKKQS